MPNPLDPDFHTVSCFFSSGGAHEGPIGEVRNVYGKKKAKEECARLTLEYLEKVHRKRVAFGEEMMRGISMGDGVGNMVVKREVEGEVEMRDGSEDEMEFEDAVEGKWE